MPEGTKLSGMPPLIEQIQTGGATEPTNQKAAFTYSAEDSIVVPKTMVVDMLAMTDLTYCFFHCD